MKLIVIKNNLQRAVEVVERAGGENLNLPILKNLLMETDDGRVKLTATNLEIAIRCFVSGKIIEAGKLTIPINILTSLIASIPSERLNLESKNNNLEIKTDNYQAVVQGAASEDFPLIPKLKDGNDYVEIETGVFKNALEQTTAASQFSELRPELNSVYLDFSLDNMKLVATDSFRLAEKILATNQFKTTHQNSFNLLIPLKTCQEISRILKDDETLRIYHDNNQILFKTNQLEFISRLTEGNFPDYQAIIPKKFSTEITLPRQEFIDSLRLTGIFSSRTNEVKIKILENQKAVEISSFDQAAGSNSYKLAAKIKGSGREIGFNWRYLVNGLKALKSDDVIFSINDDSKPSLLKDLNDASYFYILMPILKT